MYILLKEAAAGRIEVMGKSTNLDKLKKIVESKLSPDKGAWTVANGNHINGKWQIIVKK